MVCCWCEKMVLPYICPKCKRGFKGVCEKCHWDSNHSSRDDDDRRFLAPRPPISGRVDPSWKNDDDPWQQNAVRHLEDG